MAQIKKKKKNLTDANSEFYLDILNKRCVRN